jgi:hypothetical protein
VASRAEIDILLPLIVGTTTTIAAIFIHALAMIMIVHFVRRERRLGWAGVVFWKDVTVVTGAVLVALAAHLIQMAAWAIVFELCGEFREFGAALCNSAGNYTTLGCGDKVLSARWRLLGPFEAANGMLMFGLTTAMLFAVVQRLLQARLGDSRA